MAYEAGDVAVEGAFDGFRVSLFDLVNHAMRLVELSTSLRWHHDLTTLSDARTVIMSAARLTHRILC